MTNIEFRSCKCGKPLTTGDRRTKLCPICKKENLAAQAAVQNKRKNDRAMALLSHMTKRFNRYYRNADVLAGQRLMATLYAEIRVNNKAVPPDFQRALTNQNKSLKSFASYFGAFCIHHRGPTMISIFKKTANEQERQAIRHKEALKRETLPDRIFEYQPIFGQSAIAWLMEDFDMDTNIIDDEETEMMGNDSNNFEFVDNIEPAREDIEDAIYKLMKNGGLYSMGYPHHIEPHFRNQGYNADEIENALRALVESGRLNFEHGQLTLPRPVYDWSRVAAA